MLKIGGFSKLSQVSVDTLRHYDALGLGDHHRSGRDDGCCALKKFSQP